MTFPRRLAALGIDPYLLLLAATVGIAALFPARGFGAVVMDKVVYLAIALLFFLYGARLSRQAISAGILHWRLQLLVLASTFLLFPLLGLGATWLARSWLTPDLSLGLMFVCVLPSTVQSSIAFTSIARGNVPAALCAASLSNLSGMLITPALVALLLAKTHGTGFSLAALGDIALQLLLPFIAGQVMRPLIGGWLAAHPRLTAIVDRGSILLVVYAAFSEGMVAGVWSQLDGRTLAAVVVLDVLILAAVLALTTVISRVLRFPTEDEIAIVFCGSKKSMAAGIPMANVLFPDRPLGLVVLPLMLFHQAQLFACATIARRYAVRKTPEPGA